MVEFDRAVRSDHRRMRRRINIIALAWPEVVARHLVIAFHQSEAFPRLELLQAYAILHVKSEHLETLAIE